MLFNINKKRLSHDIILQINDEPVPRVKFTNFLGLIIDDQLHWNQHITSVSSKISMNIGILNKVKSILPLNTLFMLYNTMILPHYNYCNLIWGRATQSRLNKLTCLQKRAIRICSGAHYRAHCNPLFVQLRTLPLDKLALFKTGVFMHKLQHGRLPKLFSDYFIKQNMIHSKYTRRRTDFRLPIFHTFSAQNQSIRYHGVKTWNTLETQIRNLNFCSFKKTYKKILIQQMLH